MKHSKTTFDYLVIGSGAAGLYFALQASKNGTVAIITKKEIMESNSNYAQGGIAAVLDKHDSFERHIEDTMKAGAYHNDPEAVRVLVHEAPKRIADLIRLGVQFNKAEGKLCLTREGGHSSRRIVFVNDSTGREVERALIYNVRHNKRIQVFESHSAIDLVLDERGVCRGALVLDNAGKTIQPYYAKAVILATGGVGQVFLRNTNPAIATGDGIAMAHRAGAEVRDLEFVQFHPTALAKRNAPAFLVSEAVRGEGAVLRHAQGKPYMKTYHPLADLAPRDIVSRANFTEMKKGPVFLDIRHEGPGVVKQRFPSIYNELLKYNVKMDTELIPVAPAAHYMCGGVHTNLDGETNIPGLFAFGEVAHTGVHGANRLASNSLLECFVFSFRAARAARRYISRCHGEPARLAKPLAKRVEPPFDKLRVTKYSRSLSPSVTLLKRRIQTLMWNDVGIVRTPRGLGRARKKLDSMTDEISRLFNQGISEPVIELRNLHTVATLITKAALERPESLGAHFVV